MSKPEASVGVDLFCGAGGMSLGFHQAGFEVIAAVDAEKIHLDTYSKNFPNCGTWQADLGSVSGAQLRKETGVGNKQIAVVFGGPPCQGFSLIGKRLLDDPRNLLLLDMARLIAELSPSYFVVENVEGILFGRARDLLDHFIGRALGAGYAVVRPIRVLDAADIAVPQRRRRLFLLGYKEGKAPPSYPEQLSPDGKAECDRPTVWDAIADLPRIAEYDYLLEADCFKGRLGAPSVYAQALRGEVHESEDNTNGHGLTGCQRTRHTPRTIKRFRETKQGTYEEVSRFYRLTRMGVAPTLRAGTGPEHGSFMAPRPIHPFQDRCITVREAARLHSFPDWFQFHPTKWHGFRQIGNSVPPRLARAVAQSVRRALDNSN